MSDRLKQNATMENQVRRTQRLVFEIAVENGNSTPADKLQASDMSAAALLRTEEKTAEADALETLDSNYFSTAADSTGIFGLLIDTAANPPEKIYKVELTQRESGKTLVLGTKGAKITPEGRISLDLDTSSDLRTENLTATVAVEYREKA